MTQGPLAGRTIVVTRSREQASELTSGLRALGAQVIEIPTIAIVPPMSYAPLDAALSALASYDWLIVTSANTARVLAERRDYLNLKFENQPRTAAVGPATAAALKQAGLRVDLVPEPAVAEAMVGALREQVQGRRILVARAEVARDLLPTALSDAGAQVTIVNAYRTVLAEDSAALVASTFGQEGIPGAGPVQKPTAFDALTFTSSSTVKNLAALLEQAGSPWPSDAKLFSIGPVTSATLREHGHEPTLEATKHDIEGLIEAVLQGLAPAQSSVPSKAR